tara:strand:- start:720 stop:1094 length:375 start_codon:yes stop_codon:yes gene_type:complete
MKEKTSITYSVQVDDNDVKESKIEYNKYSKIDANNEKLLTYKKFIKDDIVGNNIVKNETFNELYKNNNNINEVIGHSLNKTDWNIYEYNNNNLDKKYVKEYDNIKLDINYDLLNKYKTKYIDNK